MRARAPSPPSLFTSRLRAVALAAVAASVLVGGCFDPKVSGGDASLVDQGGPVDGTPKLDGLGPGTEGAACGNARIEAPEECDGAALGGKGCTDLGYQAGALACDPVSCRYDTSGCQSFKCGDAKQNGSEQCDGIDLGGKDCSALGYVGGELRCRSDCNYDTSGCHKCGNKAVDAGEDCDGTNLDGEACKALGFDGGVLACDAGCRFDKSGCFLNSCPNGKIDSGEDCEGTNLGGKKCGDVGFDGGVLTCTANCQFNTAGCYKCGDNKKNGTEICDGQDLAGATCASIGQGFAGGALGCTGQCKYDTSGCYKCGDGKKNGTEVCDGSDFGGASCTSIGQGFTGGTLKCNAACQLDTTQCATCGNNVVESGEDCDGSAPLTKTCAQLGYSGSGGCDTTTCHFDVGRCAGYYVAVPAGTFQMGRSPTDLCGTASETPRHAVTLTHGFEIQSTEVTRQQFLGVMGYDPAPTICNDCPVVNVGWHEAAAYCNALSAKASLTKCYQCSGTGSSVKCYGSYNPDPFPDAAIYGCPGYRLPTEAEWEYAYRAGTTTAYYNGTVPGSCTGTGGNLDKIGWYDGNSSGQGPFAVAQKTPNGWGLYDMAGNAAEWCHDTKRTFDGNPITDPNAGSSYYRIVRGGSWAGDLLSARASGWRTTRDVRSSSSADTGFRCVRSK